MQKYRIEIFVSGVPDVVYELYGLILRLLHSEFIQRLGLEIPLTGIAIQKEEENDQKKES